jgi:excinuclease ABC subunit C
MRSVKGLFIRQAFTGFGPLSLRPGMQPPVLHTVRARRPSRLRVFVRRDCPRCPGVYGMIDASGELIYVGKAKNLRARLLSYFRPKSRDPKAGRILRDTRLLAWETAPSEFAALLRELELIQRWRPRCNVQGQPRRWRRVYVCVGRQPAPQVFLARRPPATAFARFGPVPAGHTAREAVRRLNDWFRLRDCPQAQEMVFADQQELFPIVRAPGCIRQEIGNCLGPCAAACSRQDYALNVQATVAFLSGEAPAVLEALEREMTAASDGLAFERAASLRDRLDALTWLDHQLQRVREAARQSFVYPVQGHEGEEWWYVIHGGRVRAVLPAPHDDAGWGEVARVLAAIYHSKETAAGPPGLGEVDGVLLVAAWFRRHADERGRTLEATAVLTGLLRKQP